MSPLRRAGQAVCWLVIMGVAATLTVAVLVPRVGGATPYAVLTGSMQPAMPPGSLVVVRPAEPEDLSIGNVITYQLVSGEPTVVTHRIVGQGIDGRGRYVFQTQGDANDVADKAWVRPEQIRGERWYDVPYLGFANGIMNGSERQLLTYAVAGLLLSYAALMCGGAAVERRRRSQRPELQHV